MFRRDDGPKFNEVFQPPASSLQPPAPKTLQDLPLVPGVPLFGQALALRYFKLELQQRIANYYGDMARVRVGTRGAVFISSSDLAYELLVEKHDALVKGPGLGVFAKPVFGNGLLTSEHDLHRRQRRLMAPMFTQKRVGQYAEEMALRAERAQAQWQNGDSIDLWAQMMRLTLDIAGKTLFGAEVGSESAWIAKTLAEMMEYVHDSTSSLVPIPPHIPTPRNLSNRRKLANLDKVIYRLIRERRESGQGQNDLLALLIAARDEDGQGQMDDRQVRDEAMTIFLASHETTATALTWAFYLLSQHPDLDDRLRKEACDVLSGRLPTVSDLPNLPYALAVLKETMRLYPPAFILARKTIRDITLGGCLIPRGTILVINSYGMHHKACYFADPQRFDPLRFLGDAEKTIPRGAYLPFGAGPRICIGNHFALMEGQLLLAHITQRVRFQLVPGQVIEPNPLMILRPRNAIRMLVHRNPSAKILAA